MVVVASFVLSPLNAAIDEPGSPLIYEGSETIPVFEIEGRPARIHTQGLCVTADSYFITGRLDRETKRPLLLRIDRATRRRVEFVNLAPSQKTSPENTARLDHPSGFDFDGHWFWIALSESRPESRSLIVRVPYAPERPFKDTHAESVFEVNDHIGSLTFDKASNRLYGANWDTKSIYIWEADGRLVRRFSGADAKGGAIDWLPAVQDWKSIGPGRVLAGGLDKRPDRKPGATRSVLEIWEIDPVRRVQSISIPNPVERGGEVANEGCAFWSDHVYFLPGDLGADATVYVFGFPVSRPR